MEEENVVRNIDGWKQLLISDPESVVSHIKEMPEDVVLALSTDPEVGEAVSAALAMLEASDGVEKSSPKKPVESREVREARGEEVKRLSLYAQIQKMDVGGKSKLARSGDKDARSILIKDGSKQVSGAVLENPKITIQEIEMISSSRNVSEDILRTISSNRDWAKSYSVVLGLANNPKTPPGISLTLLPRLVLRDLRTLAKSKGIPEVIKVTAKKIIQKKTV